MRFSTVVALTAAIASASPALASYSDFDAYEVDADLYSRAYLDSKGKVHIAEVVKKSRGRAGTGSAPRSLAEFVLYTRAIPKTQDIWDYAERIKKGRRDPPHRYKGPARRSPDHLELFTRENKDGRKGVHWAPDVKGGDKRRSLNDEYYLD